MATLGNIDDILENADWPKRTPDKLADLGPPAGAKAASSGVQLRAYSPDQPRDDHGRFGETDGGDSGGGGEVTGSTTGRMDQNAPAVKERVAEIHAKAVEHEPKITADMHELEAISGGKLVGLDFRIKGEGSTARKLATDPSYIEKGLTLDERAAGVKDSVRYTIQLDNENYASGATAALDAAREQGYDVKTSNAWTSPDGYAGYHATLRLGDQPAVELQFHTEASFKAKEFGDPPDVPASHVLYEELRVTTNPVRAQELEQGIAHLWAPIRASAPRGVLMLP